MKMESVGSRKRTAEEKLSIALLIAMHAACLLVFFVPVTAGAMAVLVGGYILRMWAITAGYHRYFSHRSYKTSRAFQFLLGLLGTMAMENGPLWWASWHRRHHRYADECGDPHSPLRVGLWGAHMGWILSRDADSPDLSNVPDLQKYPELRWLDRHKWLPIIAYAVACFAIAGVPGLVWGFVVSTLLVLHATALVNSLGHVWGTRRYATPDGSRNNAFLAVLTLGEGWHNNHHHAMSSMRQGFFWWEIDVTYYTLRAAELLGLIWDVRKPSIRALAGPRVVVPACESPT